MKMAVEIWPPETGSSQTGSSAEEIGSLRPSHEERQSDAEKESEIFRMHSD